MAIAKSIRLIDIQTRELETVDEEDDTESSDETLFMIQLYGIDEKGDTHSVIVQNSIHISM